jgi:hypothetical protein
VSDEKDQTVLDQFSLKRLYGRDRLFSGPGKRAACAVQPSPNSSASAVVSVPPGAGCCEFVGASVNTGGDGCLCCDGTFCPKRIFGDAKVFCTCPTRLEKLKEQKEHQ